MLIAHFIPGGSSIKPKYHAYAFEAHALFR